MQIPHRGKLIQTFFFSVSPLLVGEGQGVRSGEWFEEKKESARKKPSKNAGPLFSLPAN